MDISTIYIKMCESAKEIQVIPKFPERPVPKPLNPFEVMGYQRRIWVLHGDKPAVWLPRQDQLQEMVAPLIIPAVASESSTRPQRLALALSVFCYNSLGYHNEYTDQFTSMEQLWLAFTMKEKYNKVWSGKDWVNKEE